MNTFYLKLSFTSLKKLKVISQTLWLVPKLGKIKGSRNFMEFFSGFIRGCAISLLSNKGVIAPIRVRILIMVNCDV
jgi:hypothetical protein